MTWSLLINTITPHVVRIATPTGFGTGFLSFYNMDRSWCGIATAAHVVAHADEWQQPMRLYHPHSGSTTFIGSNDRVIFLDHRTDSAIVLCFKGDLEFPQVPIALLPMDQPCGLGVEVGWLGFPAVEPETLCFFSGSISARLEGRRAYLIDGVAINGVSGGPVFHTSHSGDAQIIGCVSAYHPNRVTGETLPGLLRAQDVSHFHQTASRIKNVDEANQKKKEFEAALPGATDSAAGSAGSSGLEIPMTR